MSPTDEVINLSVEQMQQIMQSDDPQLPPKCSVGIHPWDLSYISTEELENQLKLLHEFGRMPQVVALGETGFDLTRTNADAILQRRVLEAHVKLAAELGKPVVLHIVRCAHLLLGCLKSWKGTPMGHVPLIWHGYRGTAQQLKQFSVYSNIYFSLGLRFNINAARAIASDRILLETDNLSPKTSISDVANEVALARNQPVKQLEDKVAENFHNLFDNAI